jgi:dUTPase
LRRLVVVITVGVVDRQYRGYVTLTALHYSDIPLVFSGCGRRFRFVQPVVRRLWFLWAWF